MKEYTIRIQTAATKFQTIKLTADSEKDAYNAASKLGMVTKITSYYNK